MKKFIILLSMTFILSSCYTHSYFVDGTYHLSETNVQGNEKSISQDNVYSDDYLTLRSEINDTKIDLAIKNNHTSSIRVLWDEAAYIDNIGNSHRIIHMGTKLVDKEKAQVPSVIPAGAQLKDVVAPSDGIEFKNGEWVYEPLHYNKFPNSISAEEILKQYESRPELTKTQLLLPIEINGEKIEYTLTYKGSNFYVKHTKEYDATKTLIGTYATTGGLTILMYILLIPYM